MEGVVIAIIVVLIILVIAIGGGVYYYMTLPDTTVAPPATGTNTTAPTTNTTTPTTSTTNTNVITPTTSTTPTTTNTNVITPTTSTTNTNMTTPTTTAKTYQIQAVSPTAQLTCEYSGVEPTAAEYWLCLAKKMQNPSLTDPYYIRFSGSRPTKNVFVYPMGSPAKMITAPADSPTTFTCRNYYQGLRDNNMLNVFGTQYDPTFIKCGGQPSEMVLNL